MQTFVNYIIRPKRNIYDPAVDLGPAIFTVDDANHCERMDFEVTNRRGIVLKCSLYHRKIEWNQKYPLMVFCHGNSGNRTDSFGPLYWMLKAGVFMLTFDFSGCGLSGGETVSLGHYEQYDIDDVIKHMLNKYDFIDETRIGLWGRSMGAVASILYAARTNLPSLLVLDSPFSDFPTLIREYVDNIKILPRLVGNFIYRSMRDDIMRQVKFDFEDLSPLKVIGRCNMPTFFLHGTKDSLIPVEHSKKLYNAHPNEKDKVYLEIQVDHNDIRPEQAYRIAVRFMRKKWNLDKVVLSKSQKTERSTLEFSVDSIYYRNEKQRKTEEPRKGKYSVAQVPLSRSTKTKVGYYDSPKMFGKEISSVLLPKKLETQHLNRDASNPLLHTERLDTDEFQEDGIGTILGNLEMFNREFANRDEILPKEGEKRNVPILAKVRSDCPQEDSNILAEDMSDITGIELKKSAGSYIENASSKNFMLFQGKKEHRSVSVSNVAKRKAI